MSTWGLPQEILLFSPYKRRPTEWPLFFLLLHTFFWCVCVYFHQVKLEGKWIFSVLFWLNSGIRNGFTISTFSTISTFPIIVVWGDGRQNPSTYYKGGGKGVKKGLIFGDVVCGRPRRNGTKSTICSVEIVDKVSIEWHTHFHNKTLANRWLTTESTMVFFLTF